MSHRSTSRGRALLGRGHGRLLAAAALCLLLTGCGSGGGSTKDLGQVPIPTAPPSRLVPTASAGHAALVAMGDAVQVQLGGQQGRITASGPDLDIPAPVSGSRPPESSKGVVTVTLAVTAGSAVLGADALGVADELGRPVQFTTDQPSATATPGHPAVLKLTATFDSGHATLSWSQAGKPLATWDFEVELD